MLDYETQRKLIVVFVLATIIVIIGAITALVFIWMPNEEQEIVYEVGQVESVTVTEEDVVKKYYRELFVLFANADTDAIYDLVSKDYLEYIKYDKDDVVKYLTEKGVVGKALELVQYKSYSVSGYNQIYYMDLKSNNEAYAVNVVIREISPNKYTIAFDNFIDYRKNTYDTIVSSVQFTMDKVVRYTNSIEYEFKLTNKYDKNITINSGSSGNPVIIVNSQGQSKRAMMTTMSTAEIKMKPKESSIYTAVFNIEDTTDYMYYNTLVLKNVAFEGITGTNNLEYTIN